MTEWAQAASDRYSLFLYAITGITGAALDGSRTDTAAVKPSLRKELLGALQPHLKAEAEILRRRIVTVAEMAVERASKDLASMRPGMSKSLIDNLNQSAENLIAEYETQARKDVEFAYQAANRFAIAINLTMRAKGLSLTAAKLSVQREPQYASFVTLDRSGKRWASKNLIRTMVRHHLLTAHNDAYLWFLTEHGIDTAKVISNDPKHRFSGIEFSITPQPATVSYEAIRREVFHPNSNCLCGIA